MMRMNVLVRAMAATIHAHRGFRAVRVVILLIALLALASRSEAMVMSADIWEGTFDENTGDMPLYGRAVGEDPYGQDALTLYGQLEPPSGVNMDAGSDMNVFHVQVDMYGVVNPETMETGEYYSVAQGYVGSYFHGCVEAPKLGMAPFFSGYAKSTITPYFCNTDPPQSYYDPPSYCDHPCQASSKCEWSNDNYRQGFGIRMKTIWRWCTPTAWKTAGDPPYCYFQEVP